MGRMARYGWNKSFFDHMRAHASDAPLSSAASDRPTPVDRRPELAARVRELVVALKSESELLSNATAKLLSMVPEDPLTWTKIDVVRVSGQCREVARVLRVLCDAREARVVPVRDLADVVSRLLP